MPPELTETWGTYLQITSALLIFALGVTPLLLPLGMPEDIRRIFHRRSPGLPWKFLIPSFGLVAAFLIWFLHASSGIVVPEWQNWVAASTVTALLAVAIAYWAIWPRMYRRDILIRRLENDAAGTIDRFGSPAEERLKDLIYLGEQGEPGYEKALVVEALGHLALHVQNAEAYEGERLEGIIQGLEAALTSGRRLGDIGNFRLAIEVFERILRSLRDNELLSSPDMELTLRAMSRVAVASLKLQSNSAALAFIQLFRIAAAEGASRLPALALLRIGSTALAAGGFLVASSALSGLESVATRDSPMSADALANLLGLLAHFWTRGETARERAKSFLQSKQDVLSAPIQSCLRSSIEHHKLNADFDTADKLCIMLRDIEDDPTGPCGTIEGL